MEGGLCVQSMGNQVMNLLSGDCKLSKVLRKDLKSWKNMNSAVQTVGLEVHSGGLLHQSLLTVSGGMPPIPGPK